MMATAILSENKYKIHPIDATIRLTFWECTNKDSLIWKTTPQPPNIIGSRANTLQILLDINVSPLVRAMFVG